MKQNEKTELTKQKIISLAINEFGTKGYDKSSLNSICEKGIAKGLLYHNYKNKEELYFLCVKKSFLDFLNSFEEEGVIKSLKDYIRIRINFFESNKYESRIVLEILLKREDELSNEILELRQKFDIFNLFCFNSILESVDLRDDIKKEDAIEYFKFFQNMFNVYFSTKLEEKKDTSVQNRISEHENTLFKLLDYMMNGITKRSV